MHFTALGQQTLFEGCENGVDASNEEDNGDGSSRTEASRSCGVRHGSPRSVNSSSSSIAVGISDYSSSSSSSSSIVTNTTGDRVVVDSDLIVRYNQGPCILLPTLSKTLESPVDSTTAASGNSETRYNEGKGDVNGSTTRCTLSTSEASNGSLYDPPAGVPSALAVYAEGVDDAVDEGGPTDEEPPKTPCLASVSSSSSSSSGTAAAVSGMCGAGRVVLLRCSCSSLSWFILLEDAPAVHFTSVEDQKTNAPRLRPIFITVAPMTAFLWNFSLLLFCFLCHSSLLY